MKHITYLLAIVMLIAACKESYNPNISYPTTGYLVVEGSINSGTGGTTIKLSRTVKLDSNINTISENFAKVTVEGDNNTSFPLVATGGGTYFISQLSLLNTAKYRLRIMTSDGKTYLSDYSQRVQTPPIDSISFVRENNGLQLYINTHDPQNNTWYYRWEYEETWEYHSTYMPAIKYTRDASGTPNGVTFIYPATHSPDTTIFKCWQSGLSSTILTGTSTKLSEDRINLPLLFIDETSWKVSVMYSVLVKQYGLSRNSYDFWQKMKRNTEQLGSIFDAQPSEITGNIHCTTDANEPVIGYVEVSDNQEKRLFISSSQVANWQYRLFCESQDVDNQKDSVLKYAYLLPVDVSEPGGSPDIIKKYLAATPGCVDCTLRGGRNVKPSFWP
ncbi:MAG: DUF4249 domain-containing protein [Chitinophagaceae bacterium]